MRVSLHPSLSQKDLRKGQEVILNEALNVIEAREFDLQGEVVQLKHLLGENRALVRLRHDEERVVEIAAPLQEEPLSIGDHLLYESRSGYVLEKIPKSEMEELVIEEVPDASYDQIGGLAEEIEQVKDAVELPFLYPDLYAEHELSPPKGILLYGQIGRAHV